MSFDVGEVTERLKNEKEPCFTTTLNTRSHMLFTRFCNTDTFTFSQAEIIDVRSSPTLFYCFPSAYTVRHKIPQRFSMGLGSRDFACHSINCTHSAKTIPMLSFQLEWKHCLAGISKMDLQALLQKVKGGYLAYLGNQLHSSGLQGMQYSFGLDNQTQPRSLATVLLVGVCKIFSPLSANRANNRLHHPVCLN